MKRLKVLRVSKDGMSATVQGPPLSEFSLEDLMIVGPDGKSRGRMKGLVFTKGATFVECLKNAIPPGCDLVWSPKGRRRR